MSKTPFRGAFLAHSPIPRSIVRMTIGAIKQRIFNTSNYVSKDGEHVACIAPKTFFIHLDPTYLLPRPNVNLERDFFNFEGERRLLVGVTDTGLQIENKKIREKIPPCSLCMFSFPPDEDKNHKLVGTDDYNPKTYGSVFLSMHIGNPPSIDKLDPTTSLTFRTWCLA